MYWRVAPPGECERGLFVHLTTYSSFLFTYNKIETLLLKFTILIMIIVISIVSLSFVLCDTRSSAVAGRALFRVIEYFKITQGHDVEHVYVPIVFHCNYVSVTYCLFLRYLASNNGVTFISGLGVVQGY